MIKSSHNNTRVFPIIGASLDGLASVVDNQQCVVEESAISKKKKKHKRTKGAGGNDKIKEKDTLACLKC
jgi:hypothetical protein